MCKQKKSRQFCILATYQVNDILPEVYRLRGEYRKHRICIKSLEHKFLKVVVIINLTMVILGKQLEHVGFCLRFLRSK